LGYVIMSGATQPDGQPLALAAASNGSITVQDPGEVTLNLVWSLVYDIPSGNFVMVNEGSPSSGTPMVLALTNTGGGTSALQLSSFLLAGLPPGSTWDVAPGGTALAVRPTLSTSLNLNVEGSGPYQPGNPVIAYDGWGGGQPNEIWTFNALSSGGFPWNYAFTPECNQSTFLTANPDDPGGQLTIQPPAGTDVRPAPTQLWSAEYRIDGITPLGATFINEELSMALRTTPGGGAVFCADPSKIDAWSAWTVGPGPDAGAFVVYSAGRAQLVLNVSGSGPYNPGNVAITYPWQGGAENEQWIPLFVPHEVT
jgi:hypothetical protein